MKKSVLGVIQSRFDSSRLPGKALKMLGRRTLLESVIERAKLAKKINRLVLATTEREVDDPICEVGKRMGLPVVRGACDDVLARFLKALNLCPSEAVVRITGDNPLTDPFMLDRLVEHFLSGEFDFCQIENPPYGAGTDIFKATKLVEVAKKTDNARHREHLITFFLDYPEGFKTRPLPLDSKEARPDVKITVDTEEDLKRMRELMGALTDFPYSTMTDIISLSDQLQKQ
ncbi:MAG: cytidylyltransferase domain-containing protein [Nitrospinota bacterium]